MRTSPPKRDTRFDLLNLRPPQRAGQSPSLSTTTSSLSRETRRQEDGLKPPHLVQRSPSPTPASVNQEDRLQEDGLKLARPVESSLSASSPVQGDRAAQKGLPAPAAHNSTGSTTTTIKLSINELHPLKFQKRQETLLYTYRHCIV
jgi:hypothetical protein